MYTILSTTPVDETVLRDCHTSTDTTCRSAFTFCILEPCHTLAGSLVNCEHSTCSTAVTEVDVLCTDTAEAALHRWSKCCRVSSPEISELPLDCSVRIECEDLSCTVVCTVTEEYGTVSIDRRCTLCSSAKFL